jgi:hypothetical protein
MPAAEIYRKIAGGNMGLDLQLYIHYTTRRTPGLYGGRCEIGNK